VMVWAFPPGRAGRAPQASRHSNRAGVALAAEVMGPGCELVVRLAPVADVAAGFDVEVWPGPAFEADTESVRVLLEHAPTTDAKPMLPASRSN